MKFYFNVLTQPRGFLKIFELICASICIASVCNPCFEYYEANLRLYSIFVSGTFVITSSLTLLVYLFTDENSCKPYLEAMLHGFGSVLFLGLLIWTRTASSYTTSRCFSHYMDIAISAAFNVIAFTYDAATAIRIIHGIHIKKARFVLVPIDGKGTSFSVTEQYDNNEVTTDNVNY